MNATVNDQIRSAAKDAIAQRCLTQQQLAAKVGTSQPTIAQLLNGQRTGSPATWEKLLRELGLQLEMRAIPAPPSSPEPR